MNKLVKFGAAALFSLFIVACNKSDPAADYQKLTQWNEEQTKVEVEAQQTFQRDFNEALQKNDGVKAKAALDTFAKALKASADSLDKLDLSSDEVKKLRDQNKVVLTLSSEVFSLQSQHLDAPTEEAQNTLKAKVDELNKAKAQLQAETQAVEAKVKPAK